MLDNTDGLSFLFDTNNWVKERQDDAWDMSPETETEPDSCGDCAPKPQPMNRKQLVESTKDFLLAPFAEPEQRSGLP